MGIVLVYSGGSWKGPSHLVGIYQVMAARAFPEERRACAKVLSSACGWAPPFTLAETMREV